MDPVHANEITNYVKDAADMLNTGPETIVHRFMSKPKLSLVIPYMQIDDGKPDVLRDTLLSIEGVDEVVIVVNWKLGYALPINLGLGEAKGDFLLVSNDDMEWDRMSAKRLCKDDAVTSPHVNGKAQEFWGCAFCLPRWVYETVGGMYEGYDISYFDDNDYWETLKKHNIPMKCITDVNVSSEGGRTLDRFDNRDEFFEKNRKHFIQRWGFDPSGTQAYA